MFQLPDTAYRPLDLAFPDVVHDSFWDDLRALKADGVNPDLELLIHRINIMKPSGKISPTSGATLAGTSEDGLETIASNVPCCVEELNGDEREMYARRTIYVTHRIWFGIPAPEFDLDYVIQYANSRVFRVVYIWDVAGEGQDIIPEVLCKEM